jgi:TolB-like protein/tetratricopeptide (TPR) repeat protein
MDVREALQGTLGDAYTVERELGGGGMSRVFLAHDEALDRRVVVKVLPAELTAELSVERFKREIAVSAALQHPHIVPVLSAGDVDGMPYFVMPFVEGESLRQRLVRSGPLPVGELVPILRDVARALAFAHERGVVHRDVKPDNVLVSHGSAVLTDFGVAKALSDAGAGNAPSTTGALTRVGTSLGTPAYMAPEQATGDDATDHRADLYAFGVTAYELLTGRTPFAGRSLPQLLAAHIAEPAPPLVTLRPNVPMALASLVMQCLEKDPDQRPRSAADIVAALESPSVSSGPVSTTEYAVARPGSGRQWMIIAVIGVVAIAAAFGGRALLHRSSPPAAAVDERSIAVLPFATVGADTANLYFAEGMTEQLTSALADVPGLRVASRTAGLAQADRSQDPQALGQALGVATLLEGTIRRDGERIRVSARLVNTSDGLTIWSRTFEREVADVFAMQDSLSSAIVAAIRGRFGGDLAPAVVRHGTSDLEAYDLYLRGRFFFEQRGADGLRKAIARFQEAVQHDSLYADAWAGLAGAYGMLPLYGGASVDSALPLALAAADRAVALDTTRAAVYASRGSLLNSAWRWSEAEADFRRAIALDPDDATAHQWLGENLLVRGRVREAVESLQRAAQLDSLSPIILASYAVARAIGGDRDTALQLGQRAMELDPSLDAARFLLAAVHLYERDADAAITLLQPVADGKNVPVIIQGLLGYAYAVAGKPDAAHTVLARIDSTHPGGGNAAAIARVYLGLNDIDACLTWLDRAADVRDPFFASESMASPLFDPLRTQPRFRALLRRLDLDPALLARQ